MKAPGQNELCFSIFTHQNLQDNAQQIYRDLVTIFGDKFPLYRTVAFWVKDFSQDRETLHDDSWSGHPVTAQAEQNHHWGTVFLMKIENNQKLDHSVGAIYTIIHEDLRMKKLSSQWVPNAVY